MLRPRALGWLGLALVLAGCAAQATPEAPRLDEAAIRALVREGRGAEAVDAARVMVEAGPEDTAALMLLGDCLREAERPVEAVAAYLKAVDLPGDPQPALFAAAMVEESQGDRPAALALYRRAVELPPDGPFEHLAVARLLELTGDASGALAVVDGALGRFPDSDDLLIRRARLLAVTGRAGEALPLLDGVLARDPQRLDARFARQEILLALGRSSEALIEASAAVATLPEEPEAHLWQGRALLAVGDRSAAARAAARGLELAGDCACTVDLRAGLTALSQAADPGAAP